LTWHVCQAQSKCICFVYICAKPTTLKEVAIKFIFFAGVAILISCSNSKNNTGPIRVATAANLRFVMEEINAEFEVETGLKVEMISASSGKLTAQIKNGAPYDVFISANFKYPNTLHKEGYTKNKPVLFCKGTLVIWTNKEFIPDSTLLNLTDPDIEKIGIANPQNAPYGIAAEELLKNLGIFDSIKAKIVFAENVSQLNQYVINKAVDIGITAKSAVKSPKLKQTGSWKEIDPKNYSAVEEYFVKLKSKQNGNGTVESFLKFLASDKAKNILNKHGYSTSEKN
jgi:molybdate transport system substrate-binding protein